MKKTIAVTLLTGLAFCVPATVAGQSTDHPGLTRLIEA